jgi:hypothetical protein
MVVMAPLEWNLQGRAVWIRTKTQPVMQAFLFPSSSDVADRSSQRARDPSSA